MCCSCPKIPKPPPPPKDPPPEETPGEVVLAPGERDKRTGRRKVMGRRALTVGLNTPRKSGSVSYG